MPSHSYCAKTSAPGRGRNVLHHSLHSQSMAGNKKLLVVWQRQQRSPAQKASLAATLRQVIATPYVRSGFFLIRYELLQAAMAKPANHQRRYATEDVDAAREQLNAHELQCARHIAYKNLGSRCFPQLAPHHKDACNPKDIRTPHV